MYRETFPERLRKARKNTGFTQEEISKELKIPQSTLANYETGNREPNLETLGMLAEFYGVSTDWLLSVNPKKL